jgi:hypothetical protein
MKYMSSPERKYLKVQKMLQSINAHQALTTETLKLFRKFMALHRESNKYANILEKKYHMPALRSHSNIERMLTVERNRLRQVARNLAALKRVAPYEVYTLVKPRIYSPKPKKPNSPTSNIRRLFVNKR